MKPKKHEQGWSMARVEELAAQGKIRGFKVTKGPQPAEPAAKALKFRNTPTEVDGIRFDSKKEAKRYIELKLLLKAGEIGLLELQVPYDLNPGGAFKYEYYADFRYRLKTGELVVEDAKGARDRIYKKKKKLMKKLHGIEIKET